jgi:plastocyanin
MTFTKPDWRVALRKGDGLDISATYDSKRASWYEAMGIIDPLWYTTDPSVTGADPFSEPVDWHGAVTHGHLAENDHHGGTGVPILPDARRLLAGAQLKTLDIRDFVYGAGDLTLQRPPTVKQGQSLTFRNLDSPAGGSELSAIYHTITACKAPCNKVAGVAYPIADGPTFDSGELGYGPPGITPAANRATWSTPKSLTPGNYNYFCRIHPFMRGSFRVVPR